MAIHFHCAGCGKKFVVADELAGQKGTCAACGAAVVAPAVDPPSVEKVAADAYSLEAPVSRRPSPPPVLEVEEEFGDEDEDEEDFSGGGATPFQRTRGWVAALTVLGVVAMAGGGLYLLGASLLTSRAAKPKAAVLAKAPEPAVVPLVEDQPPKPIDPPATVPPPQVAPPRVEAPLNTEQLIARSEASVGVVQGPGSSGTGFLVAPGLMATNAHVIRRTPANAIKVSFPSAPPQHRGPLSAKVVFFDDDRDLAILSIPSRLDPLPVFGDHVFRRGQEVLFIGSPGLGGQMILENVASRGLLGSKVRLDDQDYYQLSGSVNGGNSGGPVLDMEGRVIAVVTARASKEEGLGFCIPAVDLGKAVRAATSRDMALEADAAQRHEAASRLATMRVNRSPGVAKGEDFGSEFLRTTEPATWLASVDSNLILKDGSPRVNPFRVRLRKADTIYLEDDRTIAIMLIQFSTKVRDAGLPFSCATMLETSLTWAPDTYFRGSTPRSFLAFAEGYCDLRINERLDHRSTIQRMQSMLAGPPPPSTAEKPSRPANPPPKGLGKSASPESPEGKWETARSLEDSGEAQGAIFAYEALIEKYPQSVQATEARKRLKKLKGG